MNAQVTSLSRVVAMRFREMCGQRRACRQGLPRKEAAPLTRPTRQRGIPALARRAGQRAGALELEQRLGRDAQLVLLVELRAELVVGGVVVADLGAELEPLGRVVIG